ITFGEEAGADVRLVGYRPVGADGADCELEVRGRPLRARVPLVGRHNAVNAACALAAALALDVDVEAAAAALSRARPAPMRGEIVDVAGRRLLVDCYNANPASMAAALDAL